MRWNCNQGRVQKYWYCLLTAASRRAKHAPFRLLRGRLLETCQKRSGKRFRRAGLVTPIAGDPRAVTRAAMPVKHGTRSKNAAVERREARALRHWVRIPTEAGH